MGGWLTLARIKFGIVVDGLVFNKSMDGSVGPELSTCFCFIKSFNILIISA